MLDAGSTVLTGLWKPRINLTSLHYGSGCVERHLISSLPAPTSKVFIITGNSLATKTPAVRDLETLLGKHHAGTISNIRQHGPLSDVDQAVETVLDRSD